MAYPETLKEMEALVTKMVDLIDKAKDGDQYKNRPEFSKTLDDVMEPENFGKPDQADDDSKEKDKSMMAAMLKKKGGY